MLDEKLEYLQYTTDTVRRLKHKTVTNSLAGTNRAMTIIARNYTGDFGTVRQLERTRRIAKATTAIKAWCGHESSKDEEIVPLNNWLPRYIIHTLTAEQLKTKTTRDMLTVNEQAAVLAELSSALTEAKNGKEYRKTLTAITQITGDIAALQNLAETLKQLEARKITYSNPQFTAGNTDDKNDRNTITYERIIGNAIRLGPLTSRCLACRQDHIKEVTKKDFSLDENARDVVLKLTAACMIAMNGKIKAVQITMADVVNWLCLASLEKSTRNAFKYHKHLLFETVEPSIIYGIKSGNTTKIRLNRDWIEDCGWELINDDEESIRMFLSEHPSGCVYKDRGPNPMEKISNM